MADLLITRTFWRAYAGVYDLIWDNGLMDRVVDEVVAQAGPGTRAVEVGSGTGLATARLVARGVDVVPSEPDPSMRARCVRRLGGGRVAARSIEEIGDLVGSRQVIVAVNVLHVVADPVRSLARLRAAVGPCGRVVVVVPVPGASLRGVARAQRGAGSSRSHVVRLYALHAVLAPLTAVARTGLVPERLHALATLSARRDVTVAGVCRVCTFAGT